MKTMKQGRITMRIFLMCLLAVLSLGACKDTRADHIKIIEANLTAGEHSKKLFIPKQDFNALTPYSSISNSVLLNFLYPGMRPVLEGVDAVWERGDKQKIVRVLLTQNIKPASIQKFSNHKKSFLKASKFIDNDYDLKHFTQPEGAVADHDDVWIDKEENLVKSVITCSDKILPTDYPQCSHFLRLEKLSITFHYDKRQLKNWKSIKEGVEEILKSYETPETSYQYYLKRLGLEKQEKNNVKH